jgi:hypothetical protein
MAISLEHQQFDLPLEIRMLPVTRDGRATVSTPFGVWLPIHHRDRNTGMIR